MVKSLGAANTAPPFWDQLSSFFQYPLQKACIGILIATTLAITIAGELGSIISLVIYVSMACVFTKYGYSIIQASTDGKSSPPTFQSAFSSENLDVFFKQLIVLVLAGLAIVPLSLTGSEFFVILGSLVINGLLPASIIILALTNRIGAALNPSLLFSVVRAIGKRYLMLWLFLFILAQSPTILLIFLIELIPSSILMPLLTLFTGYFLLVMCRLLGYTVFQNQGELGFVREEREANTELTEAEQEKLITQQTILNCETFVKEGNYKQARKVVSDRLNQRVDDPILEDYYHRLMVATGDGEAVLKNVDEAMKAFLKHNRIDLAISAFTDTLKFDKKFQPESLETTLTLATALHSKLQSDLVIKLLNGLHKRFPGAPKIADAYLLLAEVLQTSKNDPDQARRYLAFVKKQYPNQVHHPKLIELEAYLA